MSRAFSFFARMLLVALVAGFLLPSIPAVHAQQPPDKSAKPQAPDLVTIHIELTGGEKNKPIENASIYIRYNEPHKFKSDKLIEMNVKSSAEGKAKVPLVPKGRILIQVVAEGWKTYGRWFDLTDDEQLFKIHLEKPHKWY